MTAPAHPVVARWLAEPAGADVEAMVARVAATPDVTHVAVMPDVHVAGEFCVGTVVATRGTLFPRAVGGDIGCGMATMRMACDASVIAHTQDAMRLLRGLGLLVPTQRHSAQTVRDVLPDELLDAALSARFERMKARDARVQLGTLGSGNHFLELQADDDDCVWVTVHTGSRGTGQAISDAALAQAEPGPTGLRGLAAGSEAGRAYLRDVAWARAYADANRRAILDAVVALFAAMFQVAPEWDTLIACDHNHVAHEEHGGELWFVHRKGALSARDGEPGIVPGSMGTATYHTTGRGCAAALCSSSHGAGRALPRGAARRAIGLHQLRREMHGVFFDPNLEDALRDEAPSAYKDVGKVMRAQRELTRIVRRLRPLLVYKGT